MNARPRSSCSCQPDRFFDNLALAPETYGRESPPRTRGSTLGSRPTLKFSFVSPAHAGIDPPPLIPGIPQEGLPRARGDRPDRGEGTPDGPDRASPGLPLPPSPEKAVSRRAGGRAGAWGGRHAPIVPAAHPSRSRAVTVGGSAPYTPAPDQSTTWTTLYPRTATLASSAIWTSWGIHSIKPISRDRP